MNPLYKYTLKIADDSLIFGQRLSELCGKGPYLEEDIALTNIALDYLGQATNFYKYAAKLEGENKTEDDLAYLRKEKEYLNAQLAEYPNGDYAQIILKVYFYSVYLKFLYENLMQSSDEQLAALAEKSIKEVRYHYTHSSTWLKVFAQGNEESKNRVAEALENVWEYTGGLFDEVEGEADLEKLDLIPSSKKLHQDWKSQIEKDFATFGIEIPTSDFMQKGSRKGIHTEYFGYILCELQYMQRAYPGCTW
ncbi:1,2-phenylacetyl-CoA epoxidase subunit PaaC [Frigoriflavimonas asaccharolytica]|uniref:Ring-1,2-phenylacetyl-CoA epoxidase subunit PaaC n=1 Tax=Frigoriflavimonas asaccharolytica TaxID=2735899 RepID=A0A8J8GB92_9FLAO|nr:1,2-phenylacetyl-CoA epoxidase subunit PaaC [Frigoriflavimonas asaccharolytica]NRS92497.1 ring-1,2-phenylacetyl-CoA epoxidase subunit PaaC [Frigoriflavimonas asaccharolytica]